MASTKTRRRGYGKLPADRAPAARNALLKIVKFEQRDATPLEELLSKLGQAKAAG